MTVKSQHANHQLFNPLLQASKVNQTLLSDIMTSQNRFMFSSINRVINQAEQLQTATDPQAAAQINQSLIEQQYNQLTEFSQHLISSFQQAQANYQNLFIGAVEANENQQPTTSEAKEKSTTAKATNAQLAPVKAGKLKQRPEKTKAATTKISQTKDSTTKSSTVKTDRTKAQPQVE